jgi:RNA polymerase sigma-70 factor (ECF subfamily)
MTFGERLARARAGDRTALEELFSPWRSLLRLQADQSLGVELSARVDPSDIVQEACAQAFSNLEQFRGSSEGEWVNWLRCIIVGQAANVRRYHHADKRDLKREKASPSSAPGASSLDPVKALLFREQDARLAAALEALPPDMRTVVVRRVFHQEPFEVVARGLNRSPGATRVLWTRALRRLRELLGNDS